MPKRPVELWRGRGGQVLLLHQNLLQTTAAFAGLAALPRLRVLTAHHNPAADRCPDFRQALLSLCGSTLLSLDGALCDPDEADPRLPAPLPAVFLHYPIVRRAVRFSGASAASTAAVAERVYAECAGGLREHLHALHAARARRHPAVAPV